MRCLDRNVQVLFPVSPLYQSHGIVWLDSSALAFLEAACYRVYFRLKKDLDAREGTLPVRNSKKKKKRKM